MTEGAGMAQGSVMAEGAGMTTRLPSVILAPPSSSSRMRGSIGAFAGLRPSSASGHQGLGGLAQSVG